MQPSINNIVKLSFYNLIVMSHTILRNTSLIICLAVASFSKAQLSPLTIGTIPANDSIIIVYDVTINNPLPSGTSQISNQGNISGSNFSAYVTDDPATVAANDATITPLNMFPLPVVLGQFKAYKKNDDIELTWKALSEINVSKYEIERSTDSRQFQKIGEVAARNNVSQEYNFLDVQPFADKNYYRLRMVDIDSKVKYSLIALIDLGTSSQSILVYPNPVKERTLTLQLNNLPKGKYRMEMRNAQGQLVLQDEINHTGGSATQTANLPQMIIRGLYVLRLVGEKQILDYKLIIE